MEARTDAATDIKKVLKEYQNTNIPSYKIPLSKYSGGEQKR